MSSYMAKAKDPRTGEIVLAMWLDDYYGCHKYGVRFADGATYHADKCVVDDNPERRGFREYRDRADQP